MLVKKIGGRAEKMPVSSVRPNSAQVDEFRRVNEETKKVLVELLTHKKQNQMIQ